MIKLNAQFVTENDTLVGGAVEKTVITDTLFISQFAIDLNAQNLTATMEQGTLINGVFQPNAPNLQVSGNMDGAISVSNGTNASIPPALVAALVSSLKTSLDQFVLSSGLVTGTVE